MLDVWRNAAVLGGSAAVTAVAARWQGAWRWLPALVLAGIGAAFYLDALDPRWAASSVVADAPWLPACLLAVWAAHADSGWLRVRTWPLVVIVAALLGDRFVALGLAVAEPDPSRRARLVVAASGASMIGVTSGAGPLILGWGGPEMAAVGCVLAGVGFVGAASPPSGRTFERAPFDGKKALAGAVVPLLGALVAWTAILGGSLEFVAQGLEQLHLLPYAHADLLAFAGGFFAAAVGDEGVFALLVQQVELRALSLRGDAVPLALRAGLAVGGGLPLLLLARCRLRVGVPLWLAQVGIVGAWLYFR